MGCTIRVTRDDTGDALSNHHLARLLQSVSGVVSVEIEPLETVKIGEHEIPVVRDPDMPPGTFALIDPANVHRAPSMMFASVKQSEVDAYLERQTERMGHTEVTRG